jgi:hypothetical protein
MLKKIDVTFDSMHGIAHKLASLTAGTVSWDCETQETMVLIGLLTSPPRYTGLSLTHYWAWLKYAAAIHRPTFSLKLRRLLSELDPHQKTVLADDFGIGFPCHYLIDQHGFEDFADTYFLLEHALKGVVSPASKPLNGPAKLPDFIAVDSVGALHVMECKGTQTSRAYLSKALSKGVDQKKNLSNSGIFSSSMVGGIYVPQFKARKAAEIVFVDPDPKDLNAMLSELGQVEVANAVRRVSLAKTLASAGLIHFASTIMLGKVRDIDKEFLRGDQSSELEFAGYKKTDDGSWERTVEFKSYEPNEISTDQLQPVTTSVTTRIPSDIISSFRASLSSIGELPSKEVDVWIKEVIGKRRRQKVARVNIKASTDAKDVKVLERSVQSTWAKISDDPSSKDKGWTTGMGFRFSVVSERN